ncbi:tRNA (adenosine(37)-N6)-threonylcarbamoyltransferase complex dimerization subunit type 1 TsaB [Lysinibacillus fusiformis]|nr:tRNA (adenosine(37)-N6)-threonylcarbamoyltransferase complex dimerization subunit type 1 TsaB [Lysinibacillus fusiformis]
MIWLGIETSNSPLSIAIVKDGQVVGEVVQNEKLTHSVTVMPTIEELFQKAMLKPADIDAIAVSEGPGSYTGLRIGVTVAKTLAWTLKTPLVGVSSLQVLAANGKDFDGVICSLFDARRQNVYAAVYQGSTLKPIIEDQHNSIAILLEQLQELNKPVLFVGQDVENFKEKIIDLLGDQASFAQDDLVLPKGSKLIELAQQQPLPSIEEVHSFVPQYHRITEAEANWIKDQKKGQ